MNLIISENKELWNYKKKNILLGSWCLTQKTIFDKNNKNYEIIKYHWADKKKLKKDLKYLKKIHNFLTKQLKIRLNNYLNKNYSLRYFEILLSKWLWRFVLFNFDRWEIVRSIHKKKKNLLRKFIILMKKNLFQIQLMIFVQKQYIPMTGIIGFFQKF